MKQNLVILLFVVTLLLVGFLNIAYPSTKEISELENRTLAVIPELTQENLFSGEFFSSIENYYSDHFFNRETFVLFSQSLNEYKGLKGKDSIELITTDNRNEFVNDTGEGSEAAESNLVEKNEADNENEDKTLISDGNKSELLQEKKSRIQTANDLNQKVRNLAQNELKLAVDLKPLEIEFSTSPTEIEQLSITDDETLSGSINKNVLVVNDSCYEIFGYAESSSAYYANSIEAFASAIDPTDKVYSMVVPSHIEFIESKKYRNMADSQADAISYINSNFSSRVTPVNVYNILGQHANEYIYFRSDHHWTNLGGYYAYTAFAKAIGDKPYELGAFEKTEVTGFLGTLYNKTLSKSVKANPDTVEIYNPFVKSDFTIYTKAGSKLNYDVINMHWAKSSNKYMVFISGDNPLSIIDTELDNGKKIMVFKDSYGNAFIPFLTSHYDEIHIIDPRHYNKGAITYAKEHDIHEFLFVNYSVVIAGNKGFAKNIYKVSY